MIVEFVDQSREEFGVEPVCAALQAAPSTYWSAKRRPPSARALRDAAMMPILLDLWQANYSVYGARKLWVAARRAGRDIGRDQVARLMRRLDIRGAKREKKVALRVFVGCGGAEGPLMWVEALLGSEVFLTLRDRLPVFSSSVGVLAVVSGWSW